MPIREKILKEERMKLKKEKGLTVRQVADRLKVTEVYINRIINEKSRVSDENFLRIMKKGFKLSKEYTEETFKKVKMLEMIDVEKEKFTPKQRFYNDKTIRIFINEESDKKKKIDIPLFSVGVFNRASEKDIVSWHFDFYGQIPKKDTYMKVKDLKTYKIIHKSQLSDDSEDIRQPEPKTKILREMGINNKNFWECVVETLDTLYQEKTSSLADQFIKIPYQSFEGIKSKLIEAENKKDLKKVLEDIERYYKIDAQYYRRVLGHLKSLIKHEMK